MKKDPKYVPEPRFLVRSDSDMQEDVRSILPSGPCTDLNGLSESLEALSERHGEEVYATLLAYMFRLEFAAGVAKGVFEDLVRHHEEFRKKMGEAVDIRVSSLDFFTRVRRLIRNPMILETETFLETKKQVITDPMTGLFNFRHFESELDRELQRADRYGNPLSLIFIDVDHFKSINDEHGHPLGDEVLRRVAQILRQCVRNTDIACRYGGEEFAVILPETDHSGVEQLAERIRERIEKADFSTDVVRELSVSISAGISTYPRDAKDAEELTEMADRGLYLAKRNGRNRIEYAQGGGRRKPRVEAELPGSYSITANTRVPLATKNISEGGILMETHQPLAPGSLVELELALENKKSIQVLCKVVYVRDTDKTPSYDVGVTFVRMSSDDRSQYRNYLVDCLSRYPSENLSRMTPST